MGCLVAQQMSGSSPGTSRFPSLLGHLELNPQIKSLIFQTSFELQRGKSPDLRVTVGESLVKSIKCQNAPNLLQQQNAKVSPFLQNSRAWFVTCFSMCVLISGKRFPTYNKFLEQMGLEEDSRSHKKNMLTRQRRAERRADHCGRLCSCPVTSGWEGSAGRALAWCLCCPCLCLCGHWQDSSCARGILDQIQWGPLKIIAVYVTSSWRGSSVSESVFWVCWSTPCNVVEMLISSAGPLQMLYNPQSSDCLWTHCVSHRPTDPPALLVRGSCARGMTGCLLFAGFQFSSGIRYQTKVAPALQSCWDWLPAAQVDLQ